MSQIEQLTAIVSQARREMKGVYASADDIDRAIAERLVEKGAVLLPCKVGDEIYYPWIWGDTSGIAILEVESIAVGMDGLEPQIHNKDPESDMPMPLFFTSDFGETVFLTHEEAEEALERMKRNDCI